MYHHSATNFVRLPPECSSLVLIFPTNISYMIYFHWQIHKTWNNIKDGEEHRITVLPFCVVNFNNYPSGLNISLLYIKFYKQNFILIVYNCVFIID